MITYCGCNNVSYNVPLLFTQASFALGNLSCWTDMMMRLDDKADVTNEFTEIHF